MNVRTNAKWKGEPEVWLYPRRTEPIWHFAKMITHFAFSGQQMNLSAPELQTYPDGTSACIQDFWGGEEKSVFTSASVCILTVYTY